MTERYIGLDLGAERIKIAELVRSGQALTVGSTLVVEHGKDPSGTLERLLPKVGWDSVAGAAVTGRLAGAVRLFEVPLKAALAEGLPLLHPATGPWTIVSIGSHGFAVVDVLDGVRRIRENSRCAQGTGNFLRQLVERFGMTLAEADALCDSIEDPAPLSGRCPVILKTDMTHLANRGEERGRILAGLYDAVCENVQALVKPQGSGARLLVTGGVCRSARIRRHFHRLADRLGLQYAEGSPERDAFMEALGAAVVAARERLSAPPLEELLTPFEKITLERLPPLSAALTMVRRMPAAPFVRTAKSVVVGLDIGSTGSKALALDTETRKPVWQAYTYTLGNPVRAAQSLVEHFLAENEGLAVAGIATTGSGREVVGSLLSSCFGPDRVFILNEIAAHAEGALFFDPEVDTIFEIGGQDAKYIRLDGGRICDAAMNEACSAGTGSFIEEQGRKFEGVREVGDLCALALASEHGVSLGQHCSVFMAEIIEQAVASGEPTSAIVAGIYDAVVQNYLNRVKGTRSTGKLVFCQGMPFQSDALAAAVVRQTGRPVVVPPSPGIVGALGISLLAARELSLDGEPLLLSTFLAAQVESKETFVCQSKKGCGGAGNRCRIDRLRTSVAGEKRLFLWGGSCSLYDRGTRKRKLVENTPDPFAARAELIEELCGGLAAHARPRGKVGMTDEFALKGLFPFFATFVHRLGYDLHAVRNASRADLRRGIDAANVPYCAPMQLFHGLVTRMLEAEPDFLLVPMLRELPRVGDEPNSSTCPIVQAAGGLTAEALFAAHATRLLEPVLDMGRGNLDSELVRKMCRLLARDLAAEEDWRAAYSVALSAQRRFDAACLDLGRQALSFARQHGIVPVVVLGRGYTIHNEILNSNVPRILREQGALPIPVDCYPTGRRVPVFEDIIWHYSQMNLRAAHEIRRTDDLYSVFCSNYSCGPDSFNLQFYSHVMENKPFAVIETDGHAGDAGTKTRIEAFLTCVAGDRRMSAAQRRERPRNDLRRMELHRADLTGAKRRDEVVLVPPMGVGAPVTAAFLRGEGLRAEVMPRPDREALALGRRYTSGKECVPFAITLGSTLARLESERLSDERFTLVMPSASGPCRFGVYNLADKLALARAGLEERVRILCPPDTNYFAGLAADFQLRVYFGMAAADVLQAALFHVRPVEQSPGAAQAIYDRHVAALLGLCEKIPAASTVQTLREVTRGMCGIRDIVRSAARELKAVYDPERDVPTVAMVGEIYVRLDPFANDFLVERLERAGLRVVLGPLTEWIEYTGWTRVQRLAEGRARPSDRRAEAYLTQALQQQITDRLHRDVAAELGWSPRHSASDVVAAGSRFLSPKLLGEAILTLGGPLNAFARREIDGVVSVGPLECMPNKIAESYFARADLSLGLPSLTLQVNGDPLDGRLVDAFAYEVKERRARRQPLATVRPNPFTQVGRAAMRGLLTAALNLIPPAPPGRRPQPAPPCSEEVAQ